MAKQSGIHQIKGKVGQMSYYRQSGVDDGLVRRINQGMSARVKNGEEYVNTRRNNAEFGLAGKVSGVFTKGIVPKWRPMFRLFYQSKLLKDVLELVKADQTTGTGWGTRGITSARVESVIEAANRYSKNAFSNFLSSVTLVEGSDAPAGRAVIQIQYETPEGLDDYLASIDASSFNVYVNINNTVIGNYNETTGQYGITENRPLGVGSFSENVGGTSADYDATYRPSVDISTDTEISNIVVTLVAVPVRTINGNDYELQEFAAYQVFNYEQVEP